MTKKIWRWRIFSVRGNQTERVGTVTAPNGQAAIEVAIRDYKITDRWEQQRLAAEPDD
jgi:hypothetical protein